MDLKRLFNKGKRIVDQRGGVDSLKEDAAELKDIAKGKGSLTDKAKGAAAAIKEPGAAGGEEKPSGGGRSGAKRTHGEGR
ncbi:MAG TPA: hypothetical protein VEB65_13610 [Solirubrobacterales bacterium]|nr:hypothetical protein [Solirubrobacterales bacterium]